MRMPLAILKAVGKTTVKDAEARKKVVSEFLKGMEGKIDPARCFNPRHGIRATHDGKTVDLVICFECLQVKSFAGDKDGPSYLTTRSPQPTLDQVLTDAKVPLPKN